jgi:DNA-binding Lrp family transcriptional regulator
MKEIDTNLIFLQSEDSKGKIKEHANLLGKTSQLMKYSIKKIKEEEIVKNPYVIIDYSYFGLILFRIYFKGGYITEKEKGKIIKILSENSYIVSIYELNGEFDLVIEMQANNPSRFNKELKNIISQIPTLNNYKIVLNIVTHIYPRLYLIKKQKIISVASSHIIIGGDREQQTFNNNEMDIISELTKNPLERYTSISKKCKKNTKTVVNIIKNLKKKNIIKCYKSIIDIEKLNIHSYKLFLQIHNISKEREKELMDYFLNTKEIIQINKTVGDWDIEVEIESLDKSRIRFITIELREKFKEIIQSFDIIELYKYYKKSYLPGFIFNKDKKT